MGNELSHAELLDQSVSNRDFFEQFSLIFAKKIDHYREFHMGIYQHVVDNLDVLLALARESSNHFFLHRCSLVYGDAYTVEIFSRLRESFDTIEWLCNEYAISACGAIPLLLEHPVFFIRPPLEVVLRNLERMARWYKRYQLISLSPDPQTQRFVYSFYSLSEKVKMIH
jgi:hypothetical protein